ncbi:PucR family transcriptional regulator [Streptomyces fildesensis]|uniref:PucR family transcriptional regulator n=1 Tax=Streptomyces fildesensis TaxID=375757 RepID=A0ABW8C3C0_9ACTN
MVLFRAALGREAGAFEAGRDHFGVDLAMSQSHVSTDASNGSGRGGARNRAGRSGPRPDPNERTGSRQRLVKALVSEPAAPERVLAELARSADWPLADTIQAVAVSPCQGAPRPSEESHILADWENPEPYLLIAEPDLKTRGFLLEALRGRTVVIGPALPRSDAGCSLGWARKLLALLPTDAGSKTRFVQVEDHLSSLLLLQDEPLTRLLVSHRLRPLTGLTPVQSERIAQTLLAWLDSGGVAEAAKRLGVHPQTVRYRMRRAEKLFGPDLRDPQSRFELGLALHSLRLTAEVRRGRGRAADTGLRDTHGSQTQTQTQTQATQTRDARLNGL